MSADVFHAVSDLTRRGFLDQLVAGEKAANELIPASQMSQPAISQHLKVLRDAGLVKATKVGRRQMYTLVPETLREVADWVAHYSEFWTDKLENLETFLDDKAEEESRR